jgi:hypothetical protein
MRWVYIIGGSLAASMAVLHNYKYFDGTYETGDVIAATLGYFFGAAMIFVGIPAIIVGLRRKNGDGDNGDDTASPDA